MTRAAIGARDLVDGVRALSFVVRAGHRTYWVEARRDTAEKARLWCADDDGAPRPALPDDRRVHSAVYGYGARPYAVAGRSVFFVDATDQGLHRHTAGGETIALTRPGTTPTRFGAPAVSPDGRSLYAVRERDLPDGTVHDLVVVPSDGSGRITVLASGYDFYGAPAVSPDGSRIAYVAWNHPHMAWDESVLREIGPGGDRLLGGERDRSYTQPRYGPDGRLYVVHDGSGWWNLHVADGPEGALRPLCPRPAEFGRPDWHCGLSTYDFLEDGSVVAAARAGARDTLVRVDAAGTVTELRCRYTVFDGVAATGGTAAVLGASADRTMTVALLSGTGEEVRVARGSRDDAERPEWLSVPERIAFRTGDGATAHALYYPPRDGSRLPPLIVSCHGGPTVAFTGALDHEVQFWTSRGYAVAEVNYRGSPGYGRAYRESLRGRWGVTDVADCVDAARHLVAEGLADPRRLAVRGLSSGGSTALLAALRSGAFAAVTSCYGVVDPSTIPGSTHKTESRYLDGLIGSWSAERAEYESRSVLAHADALRTPTLLIHGLDDPIVPAGQSRRLARVLRERGVPVRHVTYEGEGHGFTRPENVVDRLLTELRFLEDFLGPGPSGAGEPSPDGTREGGR